MILNMMNISSQANWYHRLKLWSSFTAFIFWHWTQFNRPVHVLANQSWTNEVLMERQIISGKTNNQAFKKLMIPNMMNTNPYSNWYNRLKSCCVTLWRMYYVTETKYLKYQQNIERNSSFRMWKCEKRNSKLARIYTYIFSMLVVCRYTVIGLYSAIT